tara:strand:+ start:30810 stop:32975 length:2166 start_codon:yes stop_codon:yes gene_type:complete
MPQLSMRGFMILFLIFTLQNLKAENVLVSIQSQSEEDMHLLTAKVDEDLQQSHSGMRQTLGAIEATMSRVVDVDSEYFVAPALSVPTWSLLKDVSFNASKSEWTFEYHTMRAEPGTLNQFKRVLYFTKQGVAESGDVNNECLQADISIADCLDYLEEAYTVPTALNDPAQDYLIYDGQDSSDIHTVLSDHPLGLMQTLVITIPHTRIRNGELALAKQENFTHPTLGLHTQWTFGIGMLFHGVGSNMVIYDEFHLIENSFAQLAIARTNSYSLARHVSFWTEQVQYDPTIRIATVEYFLSSGYEIDTISASLNDEMVTQTECAEMQTKIDALADKSCLYTHQLCTPTVLLRGDSNDLISFAIPLPDRAVEGFKVNTQLNMKNMETDAEIMSTLNFNTQTNPQDVCSSAQTETFDPSSHVQVSLYKGYSLVVQHVDSTFTVENFTVQNISDDAQGMPDALMTLVFSPKDETGDAYFADFSDENIQLDELYITHALQDSTLIPDSIQNNITGVPVATGGTVATGRSQLQLDAQLLHNCPMEYTWDASVECVTTQDWTLTGKKARTISSGVNTYFVHRATFQPEDLAWLQSHSIFIEPTAANTFLDSVRDLVSDATRRGNSEFYFIFPVYAWYDQSPIGLKDKALVSFAWSVSKTPVTSRRLLQYTQYYDKRKHMKKRRERPGVRIFKKMPRIELTQKKVERRVVDRSHRPSSSFNLAKKVRALF